MSNTNHHITKVKGVKGGLITNTVIPTVGGTAGGILLNDIWEGALTGGKPFPGYGMVLFPLSTTTSSVKFGVDDALQLGIGLGVGLFGLFARRDSITNAGIGLAAGWGATKIGETMPGIQTTDATGTYFRNPISIIPHRYPPTTTP